MKRFTLISILIFTVMSFASCTMGNDVKNAGEDVKNSAKQGIEATKDKADDVVQSEKKMMNDVKNDVTRATDFTSNADKNVDRTSFITEEMAKQIAVEKAGINPNDAKFIKVDFDKDNNKFVYEIEFVAGNTEYEFDISATDGSVISEEKDNVR